MFNKDKTIISLPVFLETNQIIFHEELSSLDKKMNPLLTTRASNFSNFQITRDRFSLCTDLNRND